MRMHDLTHPGRLMRSYSRAVYEPEPFYERRPGLSIGGLVLLGGFVGLLIWAWPELHRTIRIHRM